jgi:hypothetical protein
MRQKREKEEQREREIKKEGQIGWEREIVRK